MKQVKGITLIALIITIIVMIILAAITINLTVGEDGIFSKAKRVKIENIRAELEEILKTRYAEEMVETEGNTIGIEDFADLLQSEGYDITNEEGMHYINKEKYQFLFNFIDNQISVSYVGKSTETTPIVMISNITTTSSSIKVNVDVLKFENGKLRYYYKKSSDVDYILANNDETTEKEYTYTKLEHGQKYDIKVEAISTKTGTAERTNIETISLDDLAVGNIEFNELTWNNKVASIIASTSVEGYILQTSKDGINWSDNATISDIIVGTGKTVYARLWDGNNGSSPASTQIIDNEPPTAGISLESATISGFNIRATGTDAKTGVAKYQFYVDGSLYKTEYSTSEEKICSVTGTKDDTPYSCYAIVTDAAGNSKSSGAKSIRTVKRISNETISFGEVVSWGVDSKASISVTTTSEGYTLQTSIDGKTWTPTTIDTSTTTRTISQIQGNTTVYARVWDGESNYSANVSKTIIGISSNQVAYLPFENYVKGTGIKSNPYKIENEKQLRYLAMQVNVNKNTYSGNYFKQVNNIDLSIYKTGGSATTKQWIPIGYYNSESDYKGFAGNFDGDSKEINNIYINSSTNIGQGLFAIVHRPGVLKNIVVKSGYIKGNENSSGICGAIYGGTGTSYITNCINYATIESTANVSGGVIGYAENPTIIDNCSHYGSVTGNIDIGGIVGQLDGADCIIRNCTNSGNATGKYDVGGIVGINTNGWVYNCQNIGGTLSTTSYTTLTYGDTSWQSSPLGGIVGHNNNGKIESCKNTTYILGMEMELGGIVGLSEGDSKDNNKILKCSNTGNISSKKGDTGGIVGFGSKLTIEECYNRGNVTNYIGKTVDCMGGIAGAFYYTTVKNCYNTGVIAGTINIGGIFGFWLQYENKLGYEYLYNCYNTGAVSGTTNVDPIGGNANYVTANYIYVLSTIYKSDGAGWNTCSVENFESLEESEFNSKLYNNIKNGDGVGKWGSNSNINAGRPYLLNNP